MLECTDLKIGTSSMTQTFTRKVSTKLPPKSNIAIIDDDFAIREALDDLVQSMGHQSVLFDSAEAFLAYNKRSSIDCMLVDVKMQGLSGLELQDRINKEPHRPPTIFMTSYRDERTRASALEGGALACLGKPVDFAELMKFIGLALQG
jgi:FixJ family two-component response regulator